MKKRILSMFIAVLMVVLMIPFSALTAFAATEAELNYHGIYLDVPAMIGGEKVSISDITVKQYTEAGIQINDAYKYVDVYAIDSSEEALWKKEDRFGETMGDSELYQADIDYYVTFGIKIKDEYIDTHKFAQAFVDSRNIFIQSGDNLAELSFDGDYDHIKMTVKIIPEIPKIHLEVSQLVANGTMTVGDITITDKLNGTYYTFTNNDKWLKDQSLSISTSTFVSLTEKLSADSYYATKISLQETVGYIGNNTEIIIDCPSYYVIEFAGDGFVSGSHISYIHLYCYPQEVINEVDFNFDTSIGQKISDVDFNIDTEAEFYPYAASPSWYKIINDSKYQITDPNYTIQENEEYFVVFILYPKDGYRFATNAAVTWSGAHKKTAVVQSQAHNYINVGFQFTHVVETIESLDIQVTPPIAGETPETTATETNGKANVTINKWTEGTNTTKFTGVFVEGESYTVTLYIEPTVDYKFGAVYYNERDEYVANFKVNGLNVNVDQVGGLNVGEGVVPEFIVISMTFTCAPAHTHTYTNSVLQKDSENHWLECDDAACPDKFGSRKDIAPHAPTADDGDCTTPITCVCGEVMTAGAATHTAGADDGDCTTAVKCTVCDKNAIEAKAAHADANTDGKCDACGKDMPKADDPSAPTPDLPNTNTDKETNATDATDDESKSDDETDAPVEKGCGGCGSSAALSAVALVGVIGTALVVKKKED